MKENPVIYANFENYLHLGNLKEDLENYFRTKNPALIDTICSKLEESKEVINGRNKINSAVINAVVLFVAQSQASRSNEAMEFFKQVAFKVNSETRLSLINSIVNELRYPNSHTFYFSCIILYLYVECQN